MNSVVKQEVNVVGMGFQSHLLKTMKVVTIKTIKQCTNLPFSIISGVGDAFLDEVESFAYFELFLPQILSHFSKLMT